jgi:hypothetical protein
MFGLHILCPRHGQGFEGESTEPGGSGHDGPLFATSACPRWAKRSHPTRKLRCLCAARPDGGLPTDVAGAILLIDASVRRRDRLLAERLPSYQDGSVADEAQRWLDSRKIVCRSNWLGGRTSQPISITAVWHSLTVLAVTRGAVIMGWLA